MHLSQHDGIVLSVQWWNFAVANSSKQIERIKYSLTLKRGFELLDDPSVDVDIDVNENDDEQEVNKYYLQWWLLPEEIN